jgi:hypothetical protein
MSSRTLEKITVVVAVVVLGVALAVNVRSPLVILLVGALVVTVSAGLDLVLRGEARYRPTPDLFILPAVLVVGAVLFLQLLSRGATIVLGLTVFGGLLFAAFWAEHRLRRGLADPRLADPRLADPRLADPRLADPRLATTLLRVVSYVAAFVLYAAIYQSKTRTLFSAPAIVLITLLLAARQFRLAREDDDVAEATPWPRTLLYAAAVALATGEITWALNYWPLNGLFGGAFLLSASYFMIGVLSHCLAGRLSRRQVAEYGAVAVAGTLLIAVAGLLRRGA